jgi:hypothetical protein
MCFSKKSRDRDIRWSGDDEHGVTDVLNIIIKGEGVDITCGEKLSSGLKFFTEPLNEGDDKSGLVRGFVELLEFHTDEVEPVLEASEVFNARHRKAHGLIEDGIAKPRGREECCEKTVDSPSTTVRVTTRHKA